MTLSQHRIVLRGESPYAHETEAIGFAEAELPNTNPFLVWELVELLDGSTGRLYEIDLLVLGYPPTWRRATSAAIAALRACAARSSWPMPVRSAPLH